MKKFEMVFIAFCFIFFITVFPTTVHAKSNINIVKTLCKTQKKKIKIVEGYNRKTKNIILHRKGKNYIVVEKVISRSRGFHGIDKYGFYIAYNKRIPKGKKVISYIIYNPKTNYCDDILWVVDNKTYR